MITARNRVLHVCHLDKFIPPFIDFVEEHFDDFATRHLFFINGDAERYPFKARSNIVQAGRGKKNQLLHLAALAKACQEANKIILHGLFSPYVVMLLAAMPWLLSKCYWVMWGGDLYKYKLADRNWKWQVHEFFRRPVIKNMGHLVTYIKGDYELARQWYGAKGQYQECFMYTSNLYKELDVSNIQREKKINLLVGNSADPSNNHVEVFENLEAFKNKNIKIFVPLTYGNQAYAQQIIEEGSRRFGTKFAALTGHLPLNEYLEFLGIIDIAIFNHKRQQAMGNMITLLGLGKKVYMRSDVTQWEFFKSHGITVYDIDQITINGEIDDSLEKNIDKVKKVFTKQVFLDQLSELFT